MSKQDKTKSTILSDKVIQEKIATQRDIFRWLLTLMTITIVGVVTYIIGAIEKQLYWNEILISLAGIIAIGIEGLSVQRIRNNINSLIKELE